MRLLRRRTSVPAEDSSDDATTTDVGPSHRSPMDPKGQPTPKRRDAQRRRTGPVPPPPRTRREAYRRARELNTGRRSEIQARMRAGDEDVLPIRDQGPERRMVRDVIDSRRNVAGMFLLGAAIVLVSYAVPNVQFKAFAISLWLLMFLLIVLDSIYIGFRIRRLVTKRFPKTKQRMSGLVMYGITRSTMVRRWRIPKPAVRPGEKIRD